ncbi:MAG TPA: UDP-N-acetylglucosamine--N-acetylmuramyl-(pentapeptide) pyrophosphoryl-undecaprenol N-acetylglucosamine transferase [Phycisphaerae bacterium]|nr:UDP-N-acetylglucosamine--N-acetylmuramyl-(pentapeptide) pyrophosphoryl-undecaprenol N-acetylglucosamine transferase [Phycisphaerae bacterium]
MSGPVYIFAGGGTGGHLCPAVAVAEELTALRPDARVVFACSDRAIDRRVLSPHPYAIVAQPVRPMPRGPAGWWRFGRSWRASRRLARDLLRDLQPAAVLGLGGFAAAPVTVRAARAGIRTALLSIDAVPGIANRLLARKVLVIFAQYARTAQAYGKCAKKVRVVGPLVRRELLAGDPSEARAAFGLRADRRTLLVMAGSQGAANVNRAVAALTADLGSLADSWQVLHVAGPEKLDEVREQWAGAAIGHAVVGFCDRMDLAFAAADLALCRGGASTAGELAATGTPAVVMPYPYHRDRQQYLNVAEAAEAGAVEVVEDRTDPAANAVLLRASLLAIMADPSRLEAMSQAAAGRVRADAAAEIARWMAGP